MTTTLKSSSNGPGIGWNTVYECPALTNAAVISAICANTGTVSQNVYLGKKAADGAVSALTGAIAVAATTSVDLLAGKVTLSAGESIVAKGSGYCIEKGESTASMGTVNAIYGNDTSTLIAATSTGIWRSADKGVTWTQVYSTAAVTALPGGYIGTSWFIYSSATASLKSTDDGLTWAAQAVTNAPTIVSTHTGGIVEVPGGYAGLFSGTVMSITADGITWATKTAVAAACTALCWTGTNCCMAGATALYYSPNGTAWTTVAAVSITGATGGVAAKGLLSDGAGVVLAIGATASTGSRSANNGVAWAAISGPGNLSVAGPHIYTGSKFSVLANGASSYYTSTDGSTLTWGLALNASVTPTMVAKMTSNLAFIYGTNIYTSLDNSMTGFGGAVVTASVMEVA